MKQHLVSALKYRPQSFEDVVGQEAITQTLKNAIDHKKVPQSILFCGPRGIGKTTCARIFAKMINLSITKDEKQDFSFNIFELDAASNNSVDDIRTLNEQVRIPPRTGEYKVYIIDEVHMLSLGAFNAFLKTLEEPPVHAIFILATTEKQKVIPTILSRCQIFDFKRITFNHIRDYLEKIAKKENIAAETEALQLIAQKSDGAMRDALSIFDRMVSFTDKNITAKEVSKNLNILDYDTYFKIIDSLLESDIPNVLLIFDDILQQGFSGYDFIRGLSSHFRDLIFCKEKKTLSLLEVSKNIIDKYVIQSEKNTLQYFLAALDLTNSYEVSYKNSANGRLQIELCLMQIASLDFEKKKDNFIIPPKHFKNTPKENKEISQTQPETPLASLKKKESAQLNTEIKTTKNLEEVEESSVKYSKLDKPKEATNTPPPSQNNVSAFSLKSINFQKEERFQKEKEIQENKNIVTNFSREDLKNAWEKYLFFTQKKGKENTMAILKQTNYLLLDDYKIILEVQNKSSEQEVEKEKENILDFLKKEVQNYKISIEIKAKEMQRKIKKVLYTGKEKYESLKKINPKLDVLRDTFDLELEI